MKNIVIFGAPGSGKGTQSDLMIEKYGFNHISTGDVLRNEIKNGTELGKTAKGFIDNGQLIPDELMVNILASVYDSFGKEHKGVIFDGFPRTIPQAEALKKMLAERGHKVAAMIELDVPVYLVLAYIAGATTEEWDGKKQSFTGVTNVGDRAFKDCQYLTCMFLDDGITTIGLLLTLVLIFAFQGSIILENPLHILLIAVPLILQTFLIFAIAYTACHLLNPPAPSRR